MKKFIFVALIALGFAFSANAQKIGFGVQLGGNLSGISEDPKTLDLSTKLGFQLGGFVDYSLTKDLFLKGGVLFITKGATKEETISPGKANITLNPMYIQVPIVIGYGFNVSDNFKIYANVGPYIAYGIGGKATTEISGTNSVFDGETSEDFFTTDVSKFDFGARLGLGIELNKKFIIGFDYDLGLLNMNTGDNSSDYSLKNYTMGLTLGYRF